MADMPAAGLVRLVLRADALSASTGIHVPVVVFKNTIAVPLRGLGVAKVEILAKSP